MDGEEKLWFACCICYHVFENGILLHKHRNSRHSGIRCPESLLLAEADLQPVVKLKRCRTKESRPRSSSNKEDRASVDLLLTSQDGSLLTNSRKPLTCSESGSDLTTASEKKSFARIQSYDELKESQSTDPNSYSSNVINNTNHLEVDLDAHTLSITTRTKVKVKKRKRVRSSPKTELKNAKTSTKSAATIIPSLRPDATTQPDDPEQSPIKIRKIKCRICCREFKKERKLKEHIIREHLPKVKEAKASDTKTSTKSKLAKWSGELKVRDDANKDQPLPHQPIVEVPLPSPTRAIAVGKKRKKSHKDKEDKAEKAEKLRNSESPEPELCEPLIWIRPAAEYLEPEELEPEIPLLVLQEEVPHLPPAPLFIDLEREPEIVILHQTTNSTNNNNSQARLKSVPDARLKNLSRPCPSPASSNPALPQEIGVAAPPDLSIKSSKICNASSAGSNAAAATSTWSRLRQEDAIMSEASQIYVCPHKLQCKYCKLTYDTLAKLDEHVSDRHNPKFCEDCLEELPLVLVGLDLVPRNHVHLSAKICRVCKEIVETGRKLDEHLVRHGLRIVEDTCLVCGEHRFRTKEHLRRHRLEHEEERKTEEKAVIITKQKVCGICSRNCPSVGAYRKHIELEHAKECEKIHSCHICKEKFFSSAGLDHHIKEHSSSRPNSTNSEYSAPPEVSCKICNRKFKAQGHLEDHFKSERHKNQVKNHEQNILRQKQRQIRQKQAASRTTRFTPIQKLSCRICKRVFTKKQSLYYHEDVTGHGCSYRQQGHTVTAASTQTPFNCEKCPSLLPFPSAAALDVHRRSCPSPKLLRCKRCDVAAVGTFEQLAQHEEMCQFPNVPLPQEPQPSFPPPGPPPPPPFSGQFQSRMPMPLPQAPPFHHPPPGYHQLMDGRTNNDNIWTQFPPPPLFNPWPPNFPDPSWNGSNNSNNNSNFSNYYSFS